MKKTIMAGAIALAFAIPCAHAVEIEAVPEDGIYSSVETVYHGDGSNVVIDKIGHAEGALISGGASYTLDGIGNLTIKSSESTSWLYGIYGNSSSSAKISVEAVGDVYVEAREAALHGLSGASVSVIGKNVTLVGSVDGANAIVSQIGSNVDVTATEDLTIKSDGSSVRLLRWEDGEGDISASLKAGGNINIVSTGSNSISIDRDSELTMEAGKDILLSGDVKASEATIKLTGDENHLVLMGNTKANIGTLVTADTASTDFKLDSIGDEENQVLTVTTVQGGDVAVAYTSRVSDQLAAGRSAEDLFNGVSLGNQEVKEVTVEEGSWGNGGTYTQNADGSVTAHVQENSLLSSATDLALNNAMMWRSQLSNLSDRMGTLRTMPETAGAWARYNNGRLEGRGIEHDYNTIEVGFDKAISNSVMLGVSFDYTKGDTDLTAGTSDNNTYTFGLYASYFNDSGCFLDAMLKVGRIDTDYDFYNGVTENGDYMMTGTIVGIETGHRWDIQNFFVEPQIQLTYSYLRPENYSTNLRNVEFDAMDSLIARVGVMAGMKFAEERGAAYVKASYNHDFLGDVEGRYSGVTAAGDNITMLIDDEMDDNWGEVSLGASYQATNSINTFIDVGTGFGGDIDQKWRINLGARYVF